MSIREWDKVVVCRHCGSRDLDNLEHGQGFSRGPNLDDVDVVCIWPCHHAYVPPEDRCRACEPDIRPGDEAPF